MKRIRFKQVVWLVPLFVLLVAIGGLVYGSEQLQTVQAQAFYSNGNLIQGTYWCHQDGQFLEWVWKLGEPDLPISAAAVNFELLVTNTFNGGSGFGTKVKVLILDLGEHVIGDTVLTLINPFLPQFPGNSHGIGYKAYGAIPIDPNVMFPGFMVRIYWPSADGHHFGGAKDGALLAFVRQP